MGAKGRNHLRNAIHKKRITTLTEFSKRIHKSSCLAGIEKSQRVILIRDLYQLATRKLEFEDAAEFSRNRAAELHSQREAFTTIRKSLNAASNALEEVREEFDALITDTKARIACERGQLAIQRLKN